MAPRIDDERFRMATFVDAVQQRSPDTGTWCDPSRIVSRVDPDALGRVRMLLSGY